MSDLKTRIEELGREVMEKTQELHKLRLEMPPEKVEDFPFAEPGGGEVRLSDLFGDRKDLILVHNMGSGCPYCTLWSDSFNGLLPYYEDRAAFVVVSPDEPDKQRTFADARGWKFRMVSDQEKRFTKEMGFWGSFGEEPDAGEGPWPGFSTFRKNEDGSVERIASDFFGPGDTYLGLWHMFGILDQGVGSWQPAFNLPK